MINIKKIRISPKVLYWHLSAVLLLTVAGCCGWPNVFCLTNLFYALALAIWITHLTLQGCRGRGSRIITLIVMVIVMIPAVCMMLIPSWLFCAFYQTSHPEYSKDQEQYTISNGIIIRNASYYISFNNRYFQGNISEKDLKLHAARLNYTLEEIKEPVQLPHTADAMIKFHEAGRPYSWSFYDNPAVEIPTGWSYNYISGNGGGISLFWDRASETLYLEIRAR